MSPAASGTPACIGISVTMGATATATTAVAVSAAINAANRGPTPVMTINGMSIFVNSGAPNNANGADGDVYHRTDGGVGTSVYKRGAVVAGQWTAIA